MIMWCPKMVPAPGKMDPLLLCRACYLAGKCVSIVKCIQESGQDCCGTQEQSARGWH